MKKMFTLVLLTAGTISMASAQSFKQKKSANDNHYNTTTAWNAPSFLYKEREARIQAINREFDQKIMAVKMNRRMRSQEKNKQVRILESQRKAAIAQVMERYENINHHDVGYSKGKDHKW